MTVATLRKRRSGGPNLGFAARKRPTAELREDQPIVADLPGAVRPTPVAAGPGEAPATGRPCLSPDPPP